LNFILKIKQILTEPGPSILSATMDDGVQ
jgi:hypothetical protein